MPGFPFPGRPGGEPDEPLLDMIIARRVLPPDAPQPMHDLAHMLAALAGPAEPGELAGEVAVRAAFSRATSPASISSAARHAGRRRRPARSRAWLATALVAAAAGLGSVLAAYNDVLPGPIQQLAHVAVAAPAPPSSAPARPATLGRGTPASSPAPVTGAPARRTSPEPRPSPDSAPDSSRGLFSTRGYRAAATAAPGYGAFGPACTPTPSSSTSPTSKPSARPSLPAWWPTAPARCPVVPAGLPGAPTLVPHKSLAGLR